MMNTFGAELYSSPSDRTNSSNKILDENPDSPGSLGIAMSEAEERAATNDGVNYSLGSVLNHVLMHQTVIGEEAIKQPEMTDDFPDIVIALLGGLKLCRYIISISGAQFQRMKKYSMHCY